MCLPSARSIDHLKQITFTRLLSELLVYHPLFCAFVNISPSACTIFADSNRAIYSYPLLLLQLTDA